MKLEKIKDKVWISSFEEERDRPAIGYVCGEKHCLAVDAGHSGKHVEEFYALLKEKQLPLPDLTVLTHWHWDHTFWHVRHKRAFPGGEKNRKASAEAQKRLG